MCMERVVCLDHSGVGIEGNVMLSSIDIDMTQTPLDELNRSTSLDDITNEKGTASMIALSAFRQLNQVLKETQGAQGELEFTAKCIEHYLTSEDVSLFSFPIHIDDLRERLQWTNPSRTFSNTQVGEALKYLSQIYGDQVVWLKGPLKALEIHHVDLNKLRVMSRLNEQQLKGMLVRPSSISATQTNNLEMLLAKPSFLEKEEEDILNRISDILDNSTTKDKLLRQRFKSKDNRFQEFCEYGTRIDCIKETRKNKACSKVHFRRIIRPQTDPDLGDCSYLNTCHRMDTCKYMHYELDDPETPFQLVQTSLVRPAAVFNPSEPPLPSQWINCDVRFFDFSVLGKFGVIMADPPWDIHMTLPYGTMTDDEMKAMPIPQLQDEGVIFLWVTGRAMELGRECLMEWGYERSDELVWVKTNQLQRLIRTGRTGHWLNHSKEHCLVGIKGSPPWLNRGMDADVLVAEVRETSRKPDEMYGIIERLAPGQRKIEIFGRKHNAHPGWITLGNQLGASRMFEKEVVEKYNKRYPSTPIELSKVM